MAPLAGDERLAGGVHAPVRVLQNYVMLSARLAAASPLSHGIHYIALLREPIARFLSEFYETYDGWEAKFGTPPRLPFSQACSMRLPRTSKRARTRALTTRARRCMTSSSRIDPLPNKHGGVAADAALSYAAS